MSEQIIDLEDALERVQDDKELLAELFDIFEEDYKGKRVALKELVQQKDMEKIKDIVHSIKGAAGNISAKDMHCLCSDLEKMAEEKKVDEVVLKIGGLDEKFTNLQKRMDEIREEFRAQ